MPTPLVHQQLGASVYPGATEASCSPVAELHYVTNRPDASELRSSYYRNGAVNHLQYGRVRMRKGAVEMDPAELAKLSKTAERGKDIPVRIEQAIELGPDQSSDIATLAESVNRSLSQSNNHEITIFVPGSQSSFFKSCAHATQLQHFAVGQGALINFSWPSTGRFVGYVRDTRYARGSVQHLADLIEQLADSTDAKKINIFAYSAGSQIAAPALASLRERHTGQSTAELRERYRLGNVYLAAPDISTETFFTTYLPAFQDIVGRTTFTYNREDAFLKASQRIWREPRLGRPAGGRAHSKEVAWLTQACSHPAVEAIDFQHVATERPVNFDSHSAWYRNPWVSSDLVLLLSRDLPAGERGLSPKSDGTGWYFSSNYPERLAQLSIETLATESTSIDQR